MFENSLSNGPRLTAKVSSREKHSLQKDLNKLLLNDFFQLGKWEKRVVQLKEKKSRLKYYLDDIEIYHPGS